MTSYIAPMPGHPARSPMAAVAKRWLPLALLALFFALAFVPELAFAQDAKAKIGDAAHKAFDLVFTVVYWICAIAVVVSGLGATFGRMEWGRFGQIVAGIVVVFSATMVVDYFQ